MASIIVYMMKWLLMKVLIFRRFVSFMKE